MRQTTKPVYICELDIPIFFIRRLGDRQFVVGGGGGSSKTGVPNALYVFSLTNRDGETWLRASQKLDVGSECPMNTSVHEVTSSSHSTLLKNSQQRDVGEQENNSPNIPDSSRLSKAKTSSKAEKLEKEMHCLLDNSRELIAIGLNNKCAVYQVSRSLCKGTQLESGTTGSQLGPSVISKDDLLTIAFRESFETVEGVDAAQQCSLFIPRDSSKRPAMQYDASSPPSSSPCLVTAGTDGCLRIWDATDFDEIARIKAHEAEVVDMDLSSTGDEIVTCGKDKQAHVWQLARGKKIATLKPEFPEATSCEYKPRKVRFGAQEASIVYVIWIPAVRQRKQRAPSVICLYRFRASRLTLLVNRSIQGDQLSALAVSPDGDYVACGSLEGDVHILHADNLVPFYSALEAHGTFVTDLEFSDNTFPARMLTRMNNARCTVFSVSADRRILMHQAHYQHATLRKWKKWMKVVTLLWLLVVLITQLMDYIGYFELAAIREVEI